MLNGLCTDLHISLRKLWKAVSSGGEFASHIADRWHETTPPTGQTTAIHLCSYQNRLMTSCQNNPPPRLAGWLDLSPIKRAKTSLRSVSWNLGRHFHTSSSCHAQITRSELLNLIQFNFGHDKELCLIQMRLIRTPLPSAEMRRTGVPTYS